METVSSLGWHSTFCVVGGDLECLVLLLPLPSLKKKEKEEEEEENKIDDDDCVYTRGCDVRLYVCV